MTATETRKRTRTGCLNCSRRRRKCDEVKPACTGCKRRGEKCQWRTLGAFRESNQRVLEPEHPSMKQSVGRKQNVNKFRILNVVPIKDLDQSPRTVRTDASSREASADANADAVVPASPAPSDVQAVPANTAIATPAETSTVATTTPQSRAGPQDCTASAGFATTTTTPPSSSGHVSQHAHPEPNSQVPYFSSPDFMSLISQGSFSGSYPAIASPLFDHSVFSDPGNVANDIFVPGSAYEALHTALRNRQLWTARPDIPSRGSSPDYETIPGVGVTSTQTSATDTRYKDAQSRAQAQARPGRGFALSPEREILLWQNYLNEICLWLDMFDNHHHFASTFSQMANSVPHLRYSILALSARQMERKQNEKSQSESLSLYQEAIHLLLPELESKTTPVIASCVILCVLEMLSCNPKEWRRHLDGCAYLIQAAEINGFSGKEEQALFWCFARMDVCGGLISEEETIIPIPNWIPKSMTPHEASQLFLTSRAHFDTYANYTVYLCAQTLEVLCGRTLKHQHQHQQHPSCMSCQYHYLDCAPSSGDLYVHRWKDLFDRVEQWYEQRPSQMKAVFEVAMRGPFPTVIYGNGAAISGNQLYHTCMLLLLQRKPKTLCLSKKPKSVLWHARQICSISASNSHHGCWTNALQPLWLAGKAMSHHSEHSAIVDTLTRIERETGWATTWRVEDLKEFWGDDD